MKKLKYVLLLLVFGVVTACGGGNITKENYDKISDGMSKSEVESILGEGESQASSSVDGSSFGGESMSAEVVTYESSSSSIKIISITYMNGVVQGKAQTGLD
jgi:hypothetical protein